MYVSTVPLFCTPEYMQHKRNVFKKKVFLFQKFPSLRKEFSPAKFRMKNTMIGTHCLSCILSLHVDNAHSNRFIIFYLRFPCHTLHTSNMAHRREKKSSWKHPLCNTCSRLTMNKLCRILQKSANVAI